MAVLTDTSVEVDVDLDAAIPCEHSMHDLNHKDNNGAKFLIRGVKRCCDPSHNKLFWLCKGGLMIANSAGVQCPDCGYWDDWEYFWRIVKTI